MHIGGGTRKGGMRANSEWQLRSVWASWPHPGGQWRTASGTRDNSQHW
jgi:hypothetical protein